MTEIKLINKNTNIESLKIHILPWDVVIYNKEYYVCRIEGYVHTIGGKYGDNNLWAYPRNEKPSYENLVKFNINEPVSWGIAFEPRNYIETKWDEIEAHESTAVRITRNGKHFCYVPGSGINYGIDLARVLITQFKEHPLNLNDIDFDKKSIGRKIQWKYQPAIITDYIDGQACIIIEPDPDYKDKCDLYKFNFDGHNRYSIKTEIWDTNIIWFGKEEV